MPSKLKHIISLFLLLAVVFTATTICYGNSAEPPAIVFIVPNAPHDLDISFKGENDFTEAKRMDKSFESYFYFYARSLKSTDELIFQVASGSGSYEITLEKPMKTYSNIFSLDYKTGKLTPGKLPWRTALFVLLRISLTLLIEGFIFFLFGYRKLRSWIAFLIINLVTQGWLNIAVSGARPYDSYLILGLIIYEFLILIAELIAFPLAVREHKAGRTLLYVIAANLLSLIAGGYLITVLPV